MGKNHIWISIFYSCLRQRFQLFTASGAVGAAFLTVFLAFVGRGVYVQEDDKLTSKQKSYALTKSKQHLIRRTREPPQEDKVLGCFKFNMFCLIIWFNKVYSTEGDTFCKKAWWKDPAQY